METSEKFLSCNKFQFHSPDLSQQGQLILSLMGTSLCIFLTLLTLESQSSNIADDKFKKISGVLFSDISMA